MARTTSPHATMEDSMTTSDSLNPGDFKHATLVRKPADKEESDLKAVETKKRNMTA